MDEKADLHTHTTYSDGSLSPIELLNRAKAAGIEVLGITDHDSVGAIDEAIQHGRMFGVEVVPGVELSASDADGEIHILGYFVDYRNPTLLDALSVFREKRLKRAERIVEKLNRMNIPLTIESVLANATGDSVGRPHIAHALVNGGHAESYRQAFNKYIGDGRPAYEKKEEFSLEETVRLISDSGGLSFVAHPGRTVSEEILFRLVKAGVDGIEVVHPSHTPDMVRHYRGIVEQYCLLESGGSDFHGGTKGDDAYLGQIGVSSSAVELMRRRLERS